MTHSTRYPLHALPPKTHGHTIKIPSLRTYQWPWRLTAQADCQLSACGTDPSHPRILPPKAPREISIYGVEFRLRCRVLRHLVISTIIPNCLFSTLVLLVVKNWIGKGLFSYYQWPRHLTTQADCLRSACGTDPSHSRILFPKAPGEISIYGVEFRLRCRVLGHLVVSTIIPNCLLSTLVLLVVKNWIGKGLFSYYVRYRSCAWQLARLSFPTGKGTLLLVQNEQKSPVWNFPYVRS